MKKKIFRSITLILALLIVGFTLTSCGNNQSGTPASTPGDSSTPGNTGTSGDSGTSDTPAAPAGDGKVYIIDAALAAAEPSTKNWQEAFREIERRSDGRIKINPYYAGSLLTFPEIPRGMIDGTAQWAYLAMNNYPDIMPLASSVFQLPFMGLQDPVDSCEIYMQLLDEFPEIVEEFAQFNMIPLSASPLYPYQLHLIDKTKEVRLPSDLSGMTINPFKPELQSMFDKYNVGISYIPPNQMFEALERQVIDGFINMWGLTHWFGLNPWINQHVLIDEHGLYQECFVYCVAKDFFEALPADLQKLLRDIHRDEQVEAFGGMRGYEYFWEDTLSYINIEIDYAKANGNLFVELTPEETQVWKDETAYTHQMLLDEINAQRGDDVATQVYNRVKELIAERYGS